jgi:tRNA pseudouridine55 synthase
MSWCGLVNINKPTGISSRKVVDCVQQLVWPAKAGHAGTLDPLATGVLVVCVGSATRLISHIQSGRKRYIGRFLLGKRSPTDDIDAEMVEGGAWSNVTANQIQQLLPDFLGTIQQTPPRISAVKVGGHRAYKLARRGEAVELQPRPVTIFSLKLAEFQPPEFELEIECGSGTYVRSLGRDLGERLGCGAVMSKLCRMSVGPFTLSHSILLDSIDRLSLAQALTPPLAVVADLPRRSLNPTEICMVRQGQAICSKIDCDVNYGGEVTLLDADQTLIGIAVREASSQRLFPKVILHSTP